VVGTSDSNSFGSCFVESHEPTMESDTFHDYGFECGAKDIVIAKISLKNATVAEGSEVRRIGRGGDERGVAIAVDENNRLYIVGSTTSLLAQTCTSGYPSYCGGESDTVVLMMDAMRLERLSVLQYGSPRADYAMGVLSGMIPGQIFVYGYMDGEVSSECASFTYVSIETLNIYFKLTLHTPL
jgi:hypothetical protein